MLKLKSILKHPLAIGTSTIFIANVINKGLGFLIFFLLAKTMGVQEYGKLTVVLAIISTISELVASGLNSSLVRYASIYKNKGDNYKLSALLTTSFINLIILGLIFIAIINAFSSAISDVLFHTYSYSEYVAISSYGILFTLLYSMYANLYLGLQQYKQYFFSSILLQVIRLLALAATVWIYDDSIQTILVVFILTPMFSFVLCYLFEKNILIRLKHYDFEVLKEIFSFGKWVVLWGVVAVAQSKMDIYLLANLTTVEQVAYFDVALKFLSIVMIFFGAYGTALNPKMATLKKSDEIKMLVRSTYKMMYLMMLLLGLSFFLLPIMIELIFADKYTETIFPMRIMLASLFFYVWTLPFNASVYAIGKSQVFFYSALAVMVVNLISSLYFIPKLGAIGAAISYSLVNLTALLASYLFYKYFIQRIDQ